jgi:hypothetical protein
MQMLFLFLALLGYLSLRMSFELHIRKGLLGSIDGKMGNQKKTVNSPMSEKQDVDDDDNLKCCLFCLCILVIDLSFDPVCLTKNNNM